MALNLSAPKDATPPPVKRAAAKPKPPSGKSVQREDGLNGIIQIAGFTCVMTGNLADASALGKHGPGIVKEVVKLAETNDRVASALDYITKVGPFGGLLAACMPLAMQLMVNHGVIKNPGVLPAQFGVVSKEQLEAEARLEAARMAKQAMEAEQAYQEELAAFNAELAELSQANGRAN